MLSICIPVYNVKIHNIILSLNNLCCNSGINFELLVVDDCSINEIKQVNKEICNQLGVQYIELPQNIGRAAIRNYLCKNASFPNLLFLDCDSIICNNNFIENYLPYLNCGTIVYGGTKYQSHKPERDFLLHWIYGQTREIKPCEVRNNNPSIYFKTNNFLIPKETLLKYPFDENLKGYGHEDTLMGIEFYKNKVAVTHIENPVLHAGLETNEVFIRKTEEGVKNLVKIYNASSNKEILKEHVHLIRTFSKMEGLKLTLLFIFFWKLFKPILLIMVNKFYLLKALDVYKLGMFCNYKLSK